MTISVIVAMGRNRVIGKDNQLPWKISVDLKRFKNLTMGNPIVMGRKTHQSIGKSLPGRTNIILTEDKSYQAADCLCVHSIEEALSLVDSRGSVEVFFIGGASIYEQVLPMTNKLYLTLIDHEFEGNVVFPEWDPRDWVLRKEERVLKDAQHPYNFIFQIYERSSK